MEKEPYKIIGKEFTQDELNLEQDAALFDLVQESGREEILTVFDKLQKGEYQEALKTLLKEKLLAKIIAIALTPVNADDACLTEVEAGKTTNSVALRIIADFFTLNQNLWNELIALRNKSDGTKETPTSQSTTSKHNRKATTSAEKQSP
jgi:hypothetical protein